MATARKSRTSAASASGTLLSAPFKPGKDGIVYFYFWVKFIDKLPPAGKAKLSPALLKSYTSVMIVDVDGTHREAFAPFTFDLKHKPGQNGKGQFSMKWLPPGTTRKSAEAWIKSTDGKEWAGEFPTALSSFSIRIF
ncbi:MAG: hypothetical protein SF172_14530 [Burkholderiales bacterium]|nr:hypothetical protein [Burkholderiales bacterium]